MVEGHRRDETHQEGPGVMVGPQFLLLVVEHVLPVLDHAVTEGPGHPACEGGKIVGAGRPAAGQIGVQRLPRPLRRGVELQELSLPVADLTSLGCHPEKPFRLHPDEGVAPARTAPVAALQQEGTGLSSAQLFVEGQGCLPGWIHLQHQRDQIVLPGKGQELFP